jgi:hypothetical protein
MWPPRYGIGKHYPSRRAEAIARTSFNVQKRSGSQKEAPKTDESKNRFALAVQIFNQCLHDSQLVSCTLPNASVDMTSKYFLETLIISNAALNASYLKKTFNFQKCHNAPFLASSFGMIKFKLTRNKVNLRDNLFTRRQPRDTFTYRSID